jgi:hypothetical protein
MVSVFGEGPLRKVLALASRRKLQNSQYLHSQSFIPRTDSDLGSPNLSNPQISSLGHPERSGKPIHTRATKRTLAEIKAHANIPLENHEQDSAQAWRLWKHLMIPKQGGGPYAQIYGAKMDEKAQLPEDLRVRD